MNAFSNQMSISPERPVDPFIVAILELIDRLLHDAKIPYMLVGATARDLLLHHVFGHAVTRATYDLDFAVLVDSWDQFAIVKQLFLKIPGFTDKGRTGQRLYYQAAGARFETIVDIIPFGKLETARPRPAPTLRPERSTAWANPQLRDACIRKEVKISFVSIYSHFIQIESLDRTISLLAPSADWRSLQGSPQ